MEKKNRKDKVPTKVHQVRERYQELVRSWNIYKEKHFGHTDAAIYWIFTIIISTVAAISCADNGLPVWLGFLVGFVVVFALLSIGYVIAAWIVKRMLSRGIKVLLYVASMLIVVEYLLEIGSFNKFSDLQLVGVTAGIVLVLYLFARSIGAMIKNHVYTKTTVLTCVITGAGILIGTVFLCAGGYQDTYVNQYLALNQELKEEYASVDLTGFNEDISAGSYTVKTLLYGMDSEDDLVSDVVDMTRYVGSSDGIRQMYRTWHQGYTLDEVPMAGKIYYPEEVDNCPVLFLIHGNHNFVTESYLGYDYLGEYLASNGYVVVSVDENSMNSSVFDSLSGENDGRAILLLENMKQVQEYNDDVNNVLYQKMNYEEIALAGHSRGGEAVSIAALFNEYDCYPENGNIKFNYHFQIKSVIAIAPTVDQYEPADHATALEDVNYLLIQGANDQDVSVFMGAKTYNQVSFSGEGEYLKSYLYIAGVNHGQFNELWGKFDRSLPILPFLNVANFVTEEEQQQILCTFSKVFLDDTLKGETQYADLLSNYEKYAVALPETVYIQGYSDSSFECIAGFEEDSDLTTATWTGVTLSAHYVNLWTEEMTMFSDSTSGSEELNYKLHLKWNTSSISAPNYTCEFEETEGISLDKNYIQFDLCDLRDQLVEEGKYQNLSGVVTLYDAEENTISATIADYNTVYPPLPVKLGKLAYLFGVDDIKHQDQTVRIPIQEMTGDSGFDLSKVKKVEISFPEMESGNVRIDNIGFSD